MLELSLSEIYICRNRVIVTCMVYKGFSDDDTDDDEGDVVATFGMLRSDLVEMLASIEISSFGLNEILRTNPNLTVKDVNLIVTAIENNASLTSVFSLGDEITIREIEKCVRKTYRRADLMNQMQFLQNSLRENIEDRSPGITPKEARMKYANENPDPDPLIKEALGDDYT